jgi:transposase
MAFVMVLSYSRRIFLRFSLDARMHSFLRGHAEAFLAFGGIARVILYDNLLCGPLCQGVCCVSSGWTHFQSFRV